MLAGCFFLFFVYREEVTAGVCEGLLQWYRLVLPTLFPFMLLVNLMIQTNSIHLISRVTGPILRLLPGITKTGSFVLLTGFLCGYPMGAKVSADLVRKGAISRQEGAFLLSFCNNSSPMFISGVFLSSAVTDQKLTLPLFVILSASPLLCGQLFRYLPAAEKSRREKLPFTGRQLHTARTTQQDLFQSFDASLTDACDSIVKVGLYMLVCSIFLHLLRAALPWDGIIKELLLSSLEVTGGIFIIRSLTLPLRIKYALLAGLISFGGWCAVFQTGAMLRDSGLKLGPYIMEKLVTASVTSLITYLYLLR